MAAGLPQYTYREREKGKVPKFTRPNKETTKSNEKYIHITYIYIIHKAKVSCAHEPLKILYRYKEGD